jgi:hypothetical protein
VKGMAALANNPAIMKAKPASYWRAGQNKTANTYVIEIAI